MEVERVYIPYEECKRIVSEKLMKHGCDKETADTVAEIAVDVDRDGIYSHGVNRLRRLVNNLDSGTWSATAQPEKEAGFGGFERWNAHRGIGALSAITCTDRAIALAKEHGIGCVALKGATHWFRAGTYGWRIADAGMIGIVFTNTKSNMVYHGTLDRVLGTTPLVLAVPRREGNVVADVSLGEYSYGKLQLAQQAGKQMEKFAGYDKEGNLSKDPVPVMQWAHLLPLGEYKGSAINFLLDMMGAAMALGNSCCDVRDRVPGDESEITQVFIAINSRAVNDPEAEEEIVNRYLGYLLNATPAPGFPAPRYPGMNVMKHREENLKNGIPINKKVWEDILSM